MPPIATDPTLAFVLSRPFPEQVAFFRGKLGKLLPTATWLDVKKAQHDRGFMVAGAAKADLLADLAAAVDAAIAQGETLTAFRTRFAAIVAKHGWTGWTGEATAAGRAWRTRVIYQTNLSTSYAAGRLAQLKDAGYPLWIYRHSEAVHHARPQHLAWNGLTLPANHPFWLSHYPPNGWGCRCRVLGSRGDAQTSRLGGNPDYNTPPAGWDSVLPATGEPAGIDKGWGYMPGGSVYREMKDFVAAKVTKLPPVLAKALADEVKPMLAGVIRTKKEGGGFEAQKTAKAAAEWAVKNNLADFADYSGIKPEVANAWNESMFDHLQQFPELRKDQKFIGTCQAQMARWREIEIERYIVRLRAANPGLPDTFDFKGIAEKRIKAKKVNGNTFAHSWGQEGVSGIAINKTWGNDLDRFTQQLKSNVDTQYHPVGCDTIRSVVDHELGHELDRLLSLHIDNDIIKAYQEAVVKGIKQEVSGYAAKNIKEFIAECWAESRNNPLPREFATKISEIVRARYVAKYP